MEHVNHPKHYNSHPNGIECIDIIRHYVCDIANAIKYLWRAGLKVPSKQVLCDACIDIAEHEEARPIGQTEMGMKDAEKEMEDLKKALWYIEDYRTLCHNKGCQHRSLGCAASVVLLKLTGHNINDVVKGYEKNVAEAISGLLRVGIISEHTVYAVEDWEYWLDKSTEAIRKRIADLKH